MAVQISEHSTIIRVCHDLSVWWRHDQPRRADALTWLMTRVALVPVTICALLLLGPSGRHALRITSPAQSVGLGAMLYQWRGWDTHFYLSIAQQGYHAPLDACFFPLFPLLLRIALWFSGGAHPYGTAFLAANLCSLAAFVGLGTLARAEFGSRLVARQSLRALAAYPLAFFLSVGQSDALFLALAVWCLWATRQRRWWLATMLAALAMFCRPTGVVLAAPLLFELWRQRERRLQVLAPVGLAIPLGALAVLLVEAHTYGTPGAFFAGERYFNHQTMALWSAIGLALHQVVAAPLTSPLQARALVDVLPVIGILAITILAARTLPASFTLYAAGVLLLTICEPIPTLQTVWASSGRYLLAAFPAWLALGRYLARSPQMETVYLAAGWMLQAVLLSLLLTGGWLV